MLPLLLLAFASIPAPLLDHRRYPSLHFLKPRKDTKFAEESGCPNLIFYRQNLLFAATGFNDD